MVWLFLVAFAFLYNASAIPLRAAFKTAVCVNQNVTEIDEQKVCPQYNETSTDSPFYGATTDTMYAEEYAESVNMNQTGCYVEYKEIEVPKMYPGYQRDDNVKYWWIIDYTCDLIYILDIILIRMRVRFIRNGLVEVGTTVPWFVQNSP